MPIVATEERFVKDSDKGATEKEFSECYYTGKEFIQIGNGRRTKM